MSRLKVTETFVSIQGEADAVGWPTLFIRLTGCPLRCVYCDTEYAFYGGEWRTLEELLAGARQSGVRRVCVTGLWPLTCPRLPCSAVNSIAITIRHPGISSYGAD